MEQQDDMRHFYRLSSFLFIVFLAGCSGDDSHDHPDLVTGQQLFDHHCAGCHKNTGRGNFLKGVPANQDTALSSGDIEHKIRTEGAEGMPSFPTMGEAEAAKIASYLKQM
ncbi:MAG: cytochrome c [Motiliproteus sp.]